VGKVVNLKRILIIEDDPVLAELTAEFFRDSELHVRIVIDSQVAFEHVLSWKPDVVLLDLEMPRVGGLDLVRQIRSNTLTQQVPLIVVSVIADDAWRAKSLDQVQAVFSKPVNYKELLDEVKRLCREGRLIAKKPEKIKDSVRLDKLWVERHALSNA